MSLFNRCCTTDFITLYKIYLRNIKSNTIEYHIFIDINILFDRCERNDILILYDILTNRHKIEVDINILFDRCVDVIYVYRLMIKNIKHHKQITILDLNKLFDKCKNDEFIKLYKMMIQNIKHHPQILAIDLNNQFSKLSDTKCIELYKIILYIDEIDKKKIDINELLRRLDDKDVITLIKLIPNKEDIDINYLFIYNGSVAFSLYNMMAANTINIFNIYSKLNLNFSWSSNIYKIAMSDEIDINSKFDMCEQSEIIKLYQILPNKTNVNVNLLFAKCKKSDILKLYRSIINKQDIDINVIKSRLSFIDWIKFLLIIKT